MLGIMLGLVRANVGDNVWANVMANVRANVWDNVLDNVWDNVLDNVRDNVGDNVWDNVGDNVWDNVRDNVRANVLDNVGYNVGDNVLDNVWDNVRDNVGANVRDNVGANVRDNVRANVGDNLDFIQTSSYVNYSDSGWVAFYDYFSEIGVLNFEDFKKYRSLIKNGVYYSIFFNGVAIVSRPPINVSQNEQGQAHSINGSSIKFKGYEVFCIRGVNIEKETFNKLEKNEYTFEDFVKEKNEEVKNCVLAYIEEKNGGEALYDFLSKNLKEVDTYTDKKEDKYLEGTTKGMNIGVYTLYKGEVNNIDLAFVRCYCPSTDRMFFLGVEPENTNAKDAIASLYRVPRKLVNNIKYIQRQGERFSTVFDDMEKVKSLPKEDIEDLVSLDGNKYFELMQYEY
jgi:hypothetical protein